MDHTAKGKHKILDGTSYRRRSLVCDVSAERLFFPTPHRMQAASHWSQLRVANHYRSYVLFILWKVTLLTLPSLLVCVFDVDRAAKKLILTELAPGVTVEIVRENTGAKFEVSPELKTME